MSSSRVDSLSSLLAIGHISGSSGLSQHVAELLEVDLVGAELFVSFLEEVAVEVLLIERAFSASHHY